MVIHKKREITPALAAIHMVVDEITALSGTHQLKKQQAAGFGFNWSKHEAKQIPGAIPAAQLPDLAPNEEKTWTVLSQLSGRPFRVTAAEAKLYSRLSVPLPRVSYDERMIERRTRLGGTRLYQRSCAKTGCSILTTYPPSDPWIIWDKQVYDREFGQ